MPVPSPRNSIRIARGNYADLNTHAAAFGDGEFIYAIDQDRFYTAFSGILTPVGKGVIEAEGINTLADVDTTTIAPGVGSVLKWDGSNWVPGSDLDTVTSVNSQTGAVVLDADDISDVATTNKYTTAADISKLAGIEDGATADQTAAEIKTAYESNLDTNAFTDTEKTKLANIAAGAEVNVNADWNASTGDAAILNKPTLGTASAKDVGYFATAAQGILADSAVQPGDNISDLTNDVGYITSAQAPVQSVNGYTGTVVLDKADVGLGNVDNTSDADKPVSTAQQTALDAKVDLAGDVMTGALGVPLGAAAAPAVYFDADTGIYSPGAGQVAISANSVGRVQVTSTGTVNIVGAGTLGTSQAVSFNGSAPVNSLVIDSSGRAGLGTSSPSVKLDVQNTGVNSELKLTRTDASIAGPLSLVAGDSQNNLYSQGVKDLVVYTNSVERLRIDSSGRVGVGTTTPQAPLSVSNGGTNGIEIYSNYAGSGQSGVTSFNRSTLQRTDLYISTNETILLTGGSERARITSSGQLLVGTTSWSGDEKIVIYNNPSSSGPGYLGLATGTASPSDGINLGAVIYSASNGGNIAAIRAKRDGGTWTNGTSTPTRLEFSTTANGVGSPTEQMRIGSDGQISTTAGATPGTSTFGTSLGRSGNPGLIESYRDGPATTSVCNFGGPLGNALIKCDGDLENTNNRYTGISDIKLKENIVDAESQWDDLKALRVRNYNFKEETGYNTRTQIGLVAQEVELVSPGLIGETLNDDTGEVTKNVAYSVLYMKAVKALQEAMERIETLEAEVAALKAQ